MENRLVKTPCPTCQAQTKIRATYIEKDSGDSLVIRICPGCHAEWVHARCTDRWYQCAAASPGSGGRTEGHEGHGAAESRAQRLGRLIAVFDIASEKAGLQTCYIERDFRKPTFVLRNWKLECETNAISTLESAVLREKLDRLIQDNLKDKESLRSEEELSADELQLVRAEYRRYRISVEQALKVPSHSR